MGTEPLWRLSMSIRSFSARTFAARAFIPIWGGVLVTVAVCAIRDIRAALETALYDLTPSFATAWENVAFTPVPGTPYQQVHVLFARPDNLLFGRGWRELGFMQVKLMYPLGTGSATIAAKVNALCAVFYRGASFINNNITVVIHNSPSVSAGRVEGDRYAVPIKIRFFANNLS